MRERGQAIRSGSGAVVFEDARNPGLEHIFCSGGDEYLIARSKSEQGCRYFDPDTRTFTRARNDPGRRPKRDYLRADYLL